MLISFNWLKKYVNLPDSITAEEVAEKLKMATVEVEKVERLGKGLEEVVVGEILEFRKHQSADKLSVAQVEVGEEKPRQIIFGQMAKIEVGYKVPVALAPTILPGGKKINQARIRGELTDGMLCLDQELGLLKEGVSIQIFDKEIKNGTSIIDALKLRDTIFEIDNKSLSNRPDLWGHYGIAREVAALTRHDLAPYKTAEIKGEKQVKLSVKVEDPKLCPRYMAVAVDGVEVGESPSWLKTALLAVGLRPINNIVDITNYIMYDLGQPMHAFDAAHLSDDKNNLEIIVRKAVPDEKFVTLDKQERVLAQSDLLIAVPARPVALAGVMGGENSSISSSTSMVVFESANFDPASVRKTSTRLGLRTDSSARFEKSLDPNLCELALQKAVELTLQLCPQAKVVSKVVDIKDFHLFKGPIEISLADFQKKIGLEVGEKNILDILARLGFLVKIKKGGVFAVTVPSWRATKDISIAEDIVEEVIRFFGYENIPSQLPSFSIQSPEVNQLRVLERTCRQALVSELSYNEVYNYSFVSAEQIKKLGDDLSQYIELDNPIAKDRPYNRRSLLPNLLQNIKQNIEYYPELRLFEIGKDFILEEFGARIALTANELLPRQNSYLVAIFTSKKNENPFWAARAALDCVLKQLNAKFVLALPEKMNPWEHPTRVSSVLVSKQEVGRIFELHPAVAENYGLEVRVGVLKINLNDLLDFSKPEESSYKPLPAFPEVVRDLAFTVKNNVSHEQILSAFTGADPLLKQVELFDVYVGKHIGEGYKSMAYRLTYGLPERTLTTEEVDSAQKRVAQLLGEKLGAQARQ